MPWFLVLMTSLVGAEAQIPVPLQPWVQWASDNLLLESPLSHQEGKRVSRWPSRLNLSLDGAKLEFDVELHLYREGWVRWPGEMGSWPELSLGGEGLPVVERQGLPMSWIKKGTHQLRGKVQWKEAPSFLHIPKEIGLLTLVVDGQRVDVPHLDGDGRLWFRRKSKGPVQESDSLEVKVFRKIVDEEPMEVVTHLQMSVTGREREVVLGKALLEGFKVMELNSELPARVDDNGDFRTQVRRGRHTVEISSRATATIQALKAPQLGEHWPPHEIWSIEERPEIRSIEIRDAVPVDPSQLEVPESWKYLPAYQLKAEEVLNLNEVSRGRVEVPEDELKFVRELWMDFDGQGMTVVDEIRGTLHRGQRLDASPSLMLGRAVVNSEPRLITDREGHRGVEIRERDFRVRGVSRSEGGRSLSATGWLHNAESLSATLHLPPGWELLSVRGPDRARGSWVEKWTLLDLFVVVILVFAFHRVFGWKMGVAMGVYLALSYHSPHAPRFIFALLVALAALLKVLPRGRWFAFMACNSGIALIFLLAFSMIFACQQAKEALYPTLSKGAAMSYDDPEVVVVTAFEEGYVSESLSVRSAVRSRKKEDMFQKLQQWEQQKLEQKVQTGPGEPDWSFRSFDLSWRGPVGQGESIDLILLSPPALRTLRVIRIALILGLLVVLLKSMFRWSSQPLRGWKVALVLLVGSSSLHADSFPSPELLDDLNRRMAEIPHQAKAEATVRSATGRMEDGHFLLMLEVHSTHHSSLSLPSKVEEWQPHEVLSDGSPAPAMRRGKEGYLEIVVKEGIQKVEMRGVVKGDFLQLSLPTPIHRFHFEADGWHDASDRSDGTAMGSLLIERVEKSLLSKDTLSPDPIEPFVNIERILRFDHQWRVVTEVTRLAPSDAPIHVSIPLLDGEKPLDGDVQWKDGKAGVHLPRGVSAVTWVSILEMRNKLTLQRSEQSLHRESWVLAPSPLWRITSEGIAPLKDSGSQARFMPRPGEVLTVEASFPEASQGSTLTIKKVRMVHRVGQKQLNLEHHLEVNSSQAGKLNWPIPQGQSIDQVDIDGRKVAYREESDHIMVPLRPGEQKLTLKWKGLEGIQSHWTSPTGLATDPLNNITTVVDLPSDRWVLALGGPMMGPAILFWGVLVVTSMVVLVLPLVFRRLGLEVPMSYHHWFFLNLGFCSVTPWFNLILVGWFFLFSWRKKQPDLETTPFKLRQVGCVLLTLVVGLIILGAIPFSLLGEPNMMLRGGSRHGDLSWYLDRSSGAWPEVWVFSLPIEAYRVSMLIWALWLARSMVNWTPWAWACFSHEGVWRSSWEDEDEDDEVEIPEEELMPDAIEGENNPEPKVSGEGEENKGEL